MALTIDGKYIPLVPGQDDKRFWAPMVEVQIASPFWQASLGKPPEFIIKLRALIDTGADLSTIDLGTARQIGLNKVRVDDVVRTGNRAQMEIFDTALAIVGIDKLYAKNIGSHPDHAQNSGFNFILGWDIISNYTLYLSKKENLVRLTWVGYNQ